MPERRDEAGEGPGGGICHAVSPGFMRSGNRTSECPVLDFSPSLFLLVFSPLFFRYLFQLKKHNNLDIFKRLE